MHNHFEENKGINLLEAKSMNYYKKKLQKSTILETQQRRACAQMILDHLQDEGCEKHLLQELKKFFDLGDTNGVCQMLLQTETTLKNLISKHCTPTNDNVLEEALKQYAGKKEVRIKRLTHMERIQEKQRLLQKLGGGRKNICVQETLIEYMRKLKTCFGHALHPDNQDQEDPYIPVYNIIYDRTGQLLLTGDDMGLIKIWSSSNGVLLQSLKGHTMAINSMDISFCNKYLASCSNDGLVIVWEIQTGRPIAALKEAQDDPILVLVFFQREEGNHEENYLAVASEKGYVYIYKMADIIKCDGGILGTQFNSRIKESAIKHSAQIIRLMINKIKCKNNGILCMEFNKYGYLAMGTEQGDIIIFDKPENLCKINIEWNEHQAEVHLARWSKDGGQLLTASYDGSARLWNWNNDGLEMNQKNKSYVQMKYKQNEGRRGGEINCQAIAWSAKCTYALASFTKKIKTKGDEEKAKIQIQIYSTIENSVINYIDQEKWPNLQMETQIEILEAHPYIEEIALSADKNGLIILWNIKQGIPIKIFHERGYHLKLPNLEVPLLDGCFSPNGLTFVLSTDYGSFSIYGFGIIEIFDQVPNEQFYVSDSEHPIIDENDGFKVLALDSDMEFCYVDRGNICNFYRLPYQYNFNTHFKTLYPLIIHPELIGKKSINFQKPKLQMFIQTCKDIATDNQKNDEMFYPYFQEMKDVEKKMILQIKDLFKQREQNNIIKLEQQLIETPEKLNKENNQSSNNHKLQKKIDQKFNLLNSRTFLKHDEESSAQISIQQPIQSFESKKQKRKVIDSSSDNQEQMEEINKQDIVHEQSRQTRSRRINIPRNEQRLTILNNHRQQNEIRRNRSQVTEICYRCKINIDSVIKCSECKTPYHQECSDIRLFICDMEFGNQKKICINCISILQKKKQINRSIQEYERSKYLMNDTNSPQIGDDVILFTKGYEQYLQKNIFNIDFTELSLDPHTKKPIVFPADILGDQESANFLYCKIINITYIFPIINSIIRRSNNYQTSNHIIQIFHLEGKGLKFKTFYSYDCDPYLILEEAYTQSVKQIRQFLTSSSITFQTDQDQENGIGHQYQFVTQETPDEYLNASDWQVLKCKKVQDDQYQLRNQKNMIAYCHLNFWEISSMIIKGSKPIEIQGASLQSALTNIEANQINKEINQMLKKNQRISFFFLNSVDTKLYPEYDELVPLMSYILLIQQRLEENYYRSKDQIMNDVLRIQQNANIFNPPHSEVVELSEKLVLLLTQIIEGDQLQQQQQLTEIQTRKKRRQI